MASKVLDDGRIPKTLTPNETAEVLGVSVATLATWRCRKSMPLPYTKYGKNVRYFVEDVARLLREGRRAGCAS